MVSRQHNSANCTIRLILSTDDTIKILKFYAKVTKIKFDLLSNKKTHNCVFTEIIELISLLKNFLYKVFQKNTQTVPLFNILLVIFFSNRHKQKRIVDE